jgi:hypothetical protein
MWVRGEKSIERNIGGVTLNYLCQLE